MDYLQGCTIGLDGVIAQQENYRKSGFQFAYHYNHYKGYASKKPAKHNPALQNARSIPFDLQVRYFDRQFSGCSSGG